MSNLRILLVVVLVALAGCATPERRPDVPAPVVIAPSTWRQIDRDIVVASRDATAQATDYAHDLMRRWRMLVHQRTEADFIPWFSSYWTRQWLTMKVTWYQLSAEGERDPVVERLALYLQAQYQDRVLQPVAKQISPGWIMAQATQLYIRLMREQLQDIALRYTVPADQFQRRLQGIPAIALAPPPAQSASLEQMLNAEPIDSQPAYVALVERIQAILGSAGDWSADAGISSVAQQTSKRLTDELATGGVASAVSALVGRAAGMVISLGTTAFSSILRENQRPKREAQLRKSLQAAFDKVWLDLMHNPATGVLAGIYHLAGQIEGSLAHSIAPSELFGPDAAN